MVRRLSDESFTDHVQQMGSYLHGKLEQLVAQFPSLCTAVRGMGLIQGVVLSIPPRTVVEACFAKGLLVLSAGSDVLRFVPPLVVETVEIDTAVATVREVLETLQAE
jgi:acetylornithine/succinyldiaminopimelate/putrescine aminotransferase